MAAPGGLIKFYISIRNNGSEPDSFTIMVSGPTYQISAIVRLPGVPPHHSIGW